MGVIIPGATGEQCAKFDQYLSLLLKWNRVHSLTAIRSPDEVVKRHFLESTSVLPYIVGASSLIDLGTGPGFPGIPLAIMRPLLPVTLLDSSQKKITFCQEVARVCALSNVHLTSERAEEYYKNNNSQKYDAVVSRATWSLEDYLPIASHYVQPKNGRIIALKGPKYHAELSAADLDACGLGPPEVLPLSTGGDSESNLVVLIFKAVKL
ncbi:MAG: 16S rRNA (guanine(527)-N(7))-methyltransferase RsmG [Deltaproteobacteria bacterium CG11_big_fil_rev_8_21_14_0_20_47_16]|nr:MAG: 16S rRNA (guanine(527)-N(7))-methyltransferase RsmG [Deltaproteobacteria bacterium CG11_big_fil_rev_8_21_14_0_20_47_16]